MPRRRARCRRRWRRSGASKPRCSRWRCRRRTRTCAACSTSWWRKTTWSRGARAKSRSAGGDDCSTLAYQGGGRGLETSWPTFFPKPDRTYLLALPPEISLRRLSDADRIEREPLEFHQAVAKAYERLAAAEPKRWMVLDATASPEAIHEIVRSDLAGFLKRSQPSSS